LMNLEEPPKPPGKTAVSTYLTERQLERLNALSGQTGFSHSKTLSRLIDMFYELSKET
jgi:hypothetical protein